MQQDFAEKDVKFYYVYKTLAHPEGGDEKFVNPFELKERLAHIAKAREKFGTKISWLCDSMDNSLVREFGTGNYSGVVIDKNGKIISFQRQLSLQQVRSELETLVGKVSSKGGSHVRPKEVVSKKYPRNVLPQLEVPSSLSAVKVEAKESKVPFYAKLRAEVEPDLLSGGKGKMYLGFHLDPIHEVHWNNLAQPLAFELKNVGKTVLDTKKGSAPKVKEEADLDPREFLVEVENWDRNAPITLSVTYYPCSDNEGWCKKVTQEYVIYPERDRFAGRARRAGSERQRRGRGGDRPRRGGGRGPGGGRGAGGGPGGGGDPAALVKTADADKDGAISYAEYQKIPGAGSAEASKIDFERFDTNSDGELGTEEFKALFRVVRAIRQQ